MRHSVQTRVLIYLTSILHNTIFDIMSNNASIIICMTYLKTLYIRTYMNIDEVFEYISINM